MTVDKGDAQAGSGNDRAELPQRRDRLAALKSRRQTLAESPAPVAPGIVAPAIAAPPAAAAALGGPANGLLAMLAAGKGPGRPAGGMTPPRPAGATGFSVGPMQKKIMGMAFRMLTQTPADDRGKVAGTPFTVAGVEKLMTLLSERSAAEDAPGAKAAGAALAFIGAGEGDADAIAGASADKLVLLARRVEALQSGHGQRR
jgi:hypothetical protein